MVEEEGGQMYTLEAVMAASIMLLVLLFVVEATSLTPLTSSAANVHVESQLQALGQDVLTIIDYTDSPGENSDLKEFLLHWNGTIYVWNNTGGDPSMYQYRYRRWDDNESATNDTLDQYTSDITNVTDFVLGRRGIAHNLEVVYLTTEGISTPKRVIWAGDPSDNAVVVSKKITLHDSEVNGTALETEVGIPDISDGPLYNVVDVKITMWRM